MNAALTESEESRCLPACRIRFPCRSPSTPQAVRAIRSAQAETASAKHRRAEWQLSTPTTKGCGQENEHGAHWHARPDRSRRVVVPRGEPNQPLVAPRPVVRARRPLQHCSRAVAAAVRVGPWIRRVVRARRAANRVDLIRAVVAARERRRHVEGALVRRHLRVHVLSVELWRAGDCAIARVCSSAWSGAQTKTLGASC